MKTLFITTIFMILSFSGQSEEEKVLKAQMPAKHMQVIEKYCLDCHDAETEKGSFNIDDLSFEISESNKTAETWDKVLAAMNAGEMPPEDKKQLSNDEKSDFLEDLSIEMVKARGILSDSGGYVALRRLNQREYKNSLQEILGFEPDVSLLPKDNEGSGFDTSGASLFFSSDQFEMYLETARNALRHGLVSNRQVAIQKWRGEAEDQLSPIYINLAIERLESLKKSVAFRAQDEKTPQEMGFIDMDQVQKQERGFHERMGELFNYFIRPEVVHGAPMIYFTKFGKKSVKTPTIKNQLPGKYKLRMRVASYKDAPLREQYIEYGRELDNANLEILGYKKVVADVDNPEILEFEVEHKPESKGRYFVRTRSYKLKRDRFALLRRARLKTGEAAVPGIWVDYIELEGPFPEETSKPSISKYLPVSQKESLDEVKTLIENFYNDVTRGQKKNDAFIAKLIEQYMTQRVQGKKINDAILEVYAIILSSPSFLYMVESIERGEEHQSLNAKELATRLSYFLWSSPPDRELMSLAKSGELLKAEVLKAQTSRLVNDERSDEFIANFTHQWLDMQRVDMFNFDSDHYPNFDEGVRHSARQEVYETIRYLLDNNLPLETLLKSDFVMVNEILADHYGLNNVKGEEFQKVKVSNKSPRGGLLGMAAVHIMGSDGTRSSPVERGVWVLKHVLNDPPPPAPANVPMLDRFDDTPLGARVKRTVIAKSKIPSLN